MNRVQLRSVIHRLRRVVGPMDPGGLGDAELLGRWLGERDEAAFEVLLWRHGPMVLGLCRRLLRRAEDVEDAFQATFLALVRHARSVRQREALGSWLYRVAYRVAVHARLAAAKQRAGAATALESVAERAGHDPVDRELRAVLDEEVNRLPERYRAPVVLCYFEGRTNEEAARELGRPVGTILSRLARARARLRHRLAGRGLALPVGLVAAALGRGTIEAAVPTALVTSAVQLATRTTARKAIPQHLATAAERALQTMSMTYTKLGTAVLLAIVLLGGGLGALLCPTPSGQGGEIAKPAAVGDDKLAADRGPILRWRFQVGKSQYQEQTTITKQTMTVAGMEMVQTQKQTFYFRLTPLAQKDGVWIIEQRIEGVTMDINIGGSKIEFDSTRNPAAASPLTDFLKTLVGARFKLVVTPRMEVLRVEDHEEFVKRLAKASQQMEPLIKQMLSDAALKQMSDPIFAVLKVGDRGPESVKKGDRWTRKSELDMGPVGKYATMYTYTYDGRDGKLDKIKVDTALTYTAPPKNAVGGLPFTIKKADLKSKEATGTIWFDNVRGRLDHSEMSLKLDGKLTIEIGGMETEVILEQEQKTTVRFTDENPIKAKK